MIDFEARLAALRRSLGDSDVTKRLAAVEQLRRLPPGDAGPMLVSALADAHDGVAARAAVAIAELGYEPAIQPLIRRAARLSASGDLVSAIIAALGGLRATEATDMLIGALSSEDFSVRIEAATALGRLGNRRAVPALRARLGVPDDDIMLDEVLNSLAMLGDLEGVEEATKHPDKAVRKQARSLIEFTRHRAGEFRQPG